MKPVVNLSDGRYGYRTGQNSVNLSSKPERVDGLLGVEVRNLTEGMNARIGPTGSHDADLTAERRSKGRLYGALHGRVIRLDLPAVPVRSLIFDVETVRRHVIDAWVM